MRNEDVCDYSYLKPGECAHCHGNTRDMGFTSPALPEHVPGRVVWSPSIARQKETTATRGRERGEVGSGSTGSAKGAQTGECACGRPVHNSMVICSECYAGLEKALGEVPWVIDELETSMTRQRAVGTEGGSRTSITPLPWHEKAAQATRRLHDLLVLWVRLCSEEGLLRDGLPADDSPALSRWLMRALPALARHEAAMEAHDEITDAVADGERVIFWKRRSRVYLGRCGQTVLDEADEVITLACEGDVYADPEAAVGYCEWCGQGVTVVIRQGELDQQLQSRLLTAADIADWCARMGMEAGRERVRKRVNQWHKRGRITAASKTVEGDPLFRYGEVREMLLAEFGRQTA